MQYLIHDLLKLPLADRLAVVEKILCSIVSKEFEHEIKIILDEAFSKQKS